jgi:pimeloyl-ACP methyl ester carboxylesterase
MRRLTGDDRRVQVLTPDGCGCLESSIVGCLFCLHCCNSERLGNRLAFFPPNPPSYTMAQGRDGRIHARYTDGKLQILWGKVLAGFDVDIVRTSRGEHVPCAWVAAPGDAPTRDVTLVVSHGNALDVAMFVPFARYLRDSLGVNVAAYDYTGYGGATGRPNISDTRADLRAVVDHLVDVRGVDPRRLILYGQSIGSGPTCHYAAAAATEAAKAREAEAQTRERERERERGGGKESGPPGSGWRRPARRVSDASAEDKGADNKGADNKGADNKGAEDKGAEDEGAEDEGVSAASAASAACASARSDARAYRDVGGVVLVSPIASGLNVIGAPDGCCRPACVFYWCDVYPNVRLAPKFECPTLVIHGTRDVEVPFHHGRAVRDAVREDTGSPPPYWAKGAGHGDVFEVDRREFIARLRSFVEDIDRRASENDGGARGRGARRGGEPPAMPGGMVAPTPTTADESGTRALQSSLRSLASDEEGAEEDEGEGVSATRVSGRGRDDGAPVRTAP